MFLLPHFGPIILPISSKKRRKTFCQGKGQTIQLFVLAKATLCPTLYFTCRAGRFPDASSSLSTVATKAGPLVAQQTLLKAQAICKRSWRGGRGCSLQVQMPQTPCKKLGASFLNCRSCPELHHRHSAKHPQREVQACWSISLAPLPCLAGWRGDMPWREARNDFVFPPHFERGLPISSGQPGTPRLSRKTRARERRCTCLRRLCRHLAEGPARKQRSDRHREEASKEKPHAQGLHQQAERSKDPGAQPHPSTPARAGR